MNFRRPTLGRYRTASGFTLIEMAIVSVFMAFLALLVSAVWSAFIRPTTDIADRCRINQEATHAVDSLTRDLSGSHAAIRTEGKSKYKLVGRMQPDAKQLRLCFDGGATPNGTADWEAPDYVVSYFVDSNNLVRWDEDSGATFIVAKDVDALEVTDLGDGQVQLKLAFKYRKIDQTYTLIARTP